MVHAILGVLAPLRQAAAGIATVAWTNPKDELTAGGLIFG
jgi:hypothetical protein